jgi:hypothetical protein
LVSGKSAHGRNAAERESELSSDDAAGPTGCLKPLPLIARARPIANEKKQ